MVENPKLSGQTVVFHFLQCLKTKQFKAAASPPASTSQNITGISDEQTCEVAMLKQVQNLQKLK